MAKRCRKRSSYKTKAKRKIANRKNDYRRRLFITRFMLYRNGCKHYMFNFLNAALYGTKKIIR